jgi:hypothetical protein
MVARHRQEVSKVYQLVPRIVIRVLVAVEPKHPVCNIPDFFTCSQSFQHLLYLRCVMNECHAVYHIWWVLDDAVSKAEALKRRNPK